MKTPEKGCISCPIGRCYIESFIYCPITGRCESDKEAETIPDWCPLKPLPKKKKVTGIYNGEYFKAGGKLPSYKIGWNDCINAITGGHADD